MTARPFTARQLNRTTLERQLLLGRRSLSAVDAIRTVGALQAQSPASPYLALWNRVAGFDPADLDRAFAERTVVKATLVRVTLQAVTAEDYPAFHAAMVYDLRRARLDDTRFTVAGLSVAESDALVPDVLAFARQPRTSAEIIAMLDERLGPPSRRGIWWAHRTFAPVTHAATGGPWSFGDRASYLAAGTDPFDGTRDEALAVLFRRYLEAFGPASTQDFGQFTMLPQPRAKAALAILADELEIHAGADGRFLYDVPGGALGDEDRPAPPRLLGMWDNVLLAYRDRSRLVPEAYRKVVTKNNGDLLPTILVDGYVAGVWRPTPDREGGLEVTAFHTLDDATWSELEREARALVTFLADRQPGVYSRYAHWWSKGLPAAEVRLLAG